MVQGRCSVSRYLYNVQSAERYRVQETAAVARGYGDSNPLRGKYLDLSATLRRAHDRIQELEHALNQVTDVPI